MRKKDKHIVKGIVIGAGITALGDVFIQWWQHMKKGEAFTWKNYDGWRTVKYSLIGGAIGGGLGYAEYYSKSNEESKHSFKVDNYLNNILIEERIKASPDVFNNIAAAREKIKQRLAQKFGSKLVTFPEDTGSFYKRTAIGSNYDLDIILPFKKSSYRSLEEMYYNVHDILLKEYGSRAKVTKETKAIRITLVFNNTPVQIDIVPGREINNYLIEKDLNLYVRPEWIWQNGKSLKTNVDVQKNLTVNKPEARRVIKLLKSYRDRNGLPLPTLIIDQCVVDALSKENFGIHPSDTENLLNSMDFISKKMEQRNLFDKANSNNNLLDKISDFDKIKIVNQLNEDIKKIEDNPRYIKEIFEC